MASHRVSLLLLLYHWDKERKLNRLFPPWVIHWFIVPSTPAKSRGNCCVSYINFYNNEFWMTTLICHFLIFSKKKVIRWRWNSSSSRRKSSRGCWSWYYYYAHWGWKIEHWNREMRLEAWDFLVSHKFLLWLFCLPTDKQLWKLTICILKLTSNLYSTTADCLIFYELDPLYGEK